MDTKKKKNPYSLIISSSEISQYLFCPLSWWFSRTGEKIVTKSMKLGAEFHVKHAEKQLTSRSLYIIKSVAIAVLVLIGIFAYLLRDQLNELAFRFKNLFRANG